MFIFVLILFSGFFWFYETQYITGHASASRYNFSVDNSYIFVSPLRASANGQEKLRLTVFVLNNQGLGAMGKKITLSNTEGLLVEAVQGASDDLGKAIFDISSQKAGEYYIDVKVEGTSLSQKARLSFY